MYLLAIVSRNKAAPAGFTVTNGINGLLLVVCQPPDPLPPGSAMMVLVSVFQRVGVLFAVLVVVEAHRLTQRDIQQAHQLPGFGLASGGGDEGF